MTAAVDTERAQAFAGRMMDMLSSGMLVTLTSMGHELELFDHMAALPPSRSHEIAAAAGLNERYVREWLAAMATGGIVEYDQADGTFRLPPEHAGSLTKAAGPGNLALWAWGMTSLGEAVDEVTTAFRQGGGVPYSSFTKFPSLMAAMSGVVYEAALVDVVLPLIPGLVDRLTAGIDVADIGCGAGRALQVMAAAFPNSRFTGFDFLPEAVEMARSGAAERNLANVQFEIKDAATLEGPPAFDFITAFDAIHDQAHPRRVLKGISDMLRDDGVFLCVDIDASSHLHENFDNPMATIMYAVSLLHCMTVSLALGGEGLGAMWGEHKARELLAEAGFTSVETHRIEQDPGNLYYICRK